MSEIQFAVKIHAPDIEPKYRHKQIFDTFDTLAPGEYLLLSNDHDPSPLLLQFMMSKEGTFNWEYLEKGPELWRVAIGKE